METCAAEAGLLKKKPCGQAAVAKCANCEMPLCGKHAVPQFSANKQRTGKFMCSECDRAQREHEKLARPVARAAQPAPKPAAPAAKPAAQAAKPAAAPAPLPKDSPAMQPSGKKELSLEDSQPLEFTPSKKPEEKK